LLSFIFLDIQLFVRNNPCALITGGLKFWRSFFRLLIFSGSRLKTDRRRIGFGKFRCLEFIPNANERRNYSNRQGRFVEIRSG